MKTVQHVSARSSYYNKNMDLYRIAANAAIHTGIPTKLNYQKVFWLGYVFC